MASTIQGAVTPAATSRPSLRETWPLQRSDALLFLAHVRRPDRHLVGDGLVAHRAPRGLGARARRRGRVAVVRRPPHRAARRLGDGGRDARRHVRQDHRHRRHRRDHARRVAQLARAVDGRHPADPRSVRVHHRHLDRRPATTGRAEARGVAGRQQLPVRAHRRSRRLQRHRRRRLLALPERLGAHGRRRAGRGDPRHRRVWRACTPACTTSPTSSPACCSAWPACSSCGWCCATARRPRRREPHARSSCSWPPWPGSPPSPARRRRSSTRSTRRPRSRRSSARSPVTRVSTASCASASTGGPAAGSCSRSAS